MTKTIVTPFEYQTEILVMMDDWYNTEEYPSLETYFNNHYTAINLSRAFVDDYVALEGVTDDYYKKVEEAYSALLDEFGIQEGRGFRDFLEFHKALEEKIGGK